MDAQSRPWKAREEEERRRIKRKEMGLRKEDWDVKRNKGKRSQGMHMEVARGEQKQGHKRYRKGEKINRKKGKERECKNVNREIKEKNYNTWIYLQRKIGKKSDTKGTGEERK